MAAMSTATVERERLAAVLGVAVPRDLSVADAARVSGFSRPAVYRAIDRGDLAASVVCSRLRIHPDDFLVWMEGDRAVPRQRPHTVAGFGARKAPAVNGLRSLIAEREPAA
jgi:hypothetical protein